MAHPVRFGDDPPPTPFAAPQLGQHSREILESFGYPAEEIERLRGAGVVI
jgi:crotonobetainyl-CoA:carnitine CoA-transferase CaiB-like acyl-CoA transferase